MFRINLYHCYKINRPNWIKLYGEHFQEKSYVLVGWKEDMPTFAKIIDVLLVSEFPMLVVEVYDTERYDSHLIVLNVHIS